MQPLREQMASAEQVALFSRKSFRTLVRAIGLGHVGELTAEESASTLFRFFRSNHVFDLRLLFTLALLPFAFFAAYLLCGFLVEPAIGVLHMFGINRADFLAKFFDTPSYPSAVIVACGAIITWAYQSASARLGVIDLFACEISTLCRVGTIFDVGKRYIDQYDAPPQNSSAATRKEPAHSDSAESKEEYFPVFDNNARDLQLLEATVVTHITEFYTYMKAVRDLQRMLAAIAPPQAANPNRGSAVAVTEPDPWHEALSNLIYMLFLAYESARKAIEDLIEFEPTRVECTVVMLLTELKCYPLLLRHFRTYLGENDPRYLRLKLREESYKIIAHEVYGAVVSRGEDETDWLPAKRTAGELAKRYKEAFGEDLASPRAPHSASAGTRHHVRGPGTRPAPDDLPRAPGPRKHAEQPASKEAGAPI
jgi:hypothetical protein